MSVANFPELAQWYTPTQVPPEATTEPYIGGPSSFIPAGIPHLKVSINKVIPIDLYWDGQQFKYHPNENVNLQNNYYSNIFRYHIPFTLPDGQVGLITVADTSKWSSEYYFPVKQKQGWTAKETALFIITSLPVGDYLEIETYLSPTSSEVYSITKNANGTYDIIEDSTDTTINVDINQLNAFIERLRRIIAVSDNNKVYYHCDPRIPSHTGCEATLEPVVSQAQKLFRQQSRQRETYRSQIRPQLRQIGGQIEGALPGTLPNLPQGGQGFQETQEYFENL